MSTTDLLVVGGGMAGLTAGARAANAGARVTLVERGPAIGGTATYAGFVWTAPTADTMAEVNPGADQHLTREIVERFPAALEWISSLGVDMRPTVVLNRFGRGNQTDMPSYLHACARLIRQNGGSILTETSVDSLLTDDVGRVVGAELEASDGTRSDVRAVATVLATGGFGGNPELRRELIHDNALDMPLRANPYSMGDGLRLGRAAGAAVGQDHAGFYGHLVPSHVNYGDPDYFTQLTFYHSEHSVLLNTEGSRFTDETIGDHITPMYLLEQEQPRGLLIYDQRVRDEWMMRPYVEGIEPLDKFQLAYRRGARCAVAVDLEELSYLPEEWGYPGDVVRRTMEEFNAAAQAGRHNPPRSVDPTPLVDPPYYVIEVIPAITFTFTGLVIDPQARVLRVDGTPIPGLLAAGADAGGTHNRAYTGGIAMAMVLGMIAAETFLGAAAASAGASRQT